MTSMRTKARLVALWVFGLLAGGLWGQIVGEYLGASSRELTGFFAGFFAFACLRLWLTERRPHMEPSEE